MSPARMDGPMDVVQFACAVVVGVVNILAVLGVVRASAVSRWGSGALVLIIAIRTARRVSSGVHFGRGVAGVILLFLSTF